MKKLLFVSVNDHVPWGGSEVLWSKTAMALTKEHSISVLIKKWPDDPKAIKALRASGARIIYKRDLKAKPKQAIEHRVLKKLGVFTKDKELPVYDFKEYDLVIFSLGNHLDPGVLAYQKALNASHTPYVVINQLVTDLRMVKARVLDAFQRFYQEAKAVYLLSKDNQTKLEMQLAIPLDQAVYIDNPFDYKQEYVPVLKSRSTHIACVAALTTFHKGQDILLKVLSQDKWRDRDFTLNLYGTGQDEKQIRKLIDMYGLNGKVNLHGHVADKEAIWKNNAMCILPSRMEGQSLAMLEAMSFGRPVVATRVGDTDRLILSGETGYTIEAATIHHIDLALEKMWKLQEHWEAMGIAARAHLFKTIPTDPVIAFKEKIEAVL